MIIAKEIPSDIFYYDDEEGVFSQEMSTLEGNGFNPFSQIYDDACDAGFTMVSVKTGKKVTFYESEMFRNDDNDITHWDFEATPESLKAIPGSCCWKVVLFND